MNVDNYPIHPDFQGYSPNEMQSMLYGIFAEDCPVQLLQLSEADYKKIPILNQIKYLLKLIADKGELNLTAKGYLPPKIVVDIYNQKFITERMIESGIVKLRIEKDSRTVQLTKILLELAGLIKKRNNKLSLTKRGDTELNNNPKLLKTIFKVFGAKFNLAYFDRYPEGDIGQIGFGFSLVLLHKYGSTKQQNTFYAEKYFAAFPTMLEMIEPSHFKSAKKQAFSCYTLRTFNRFLKYFGIITIDSEKKWDADEYITKTQLFDKLIKVLPHKE